MYKGSWLHMEFVCLFAFGWRIVKRDNLFLNKNSRLLLAKVRFVGT